MTLKEAALRAAADAFAPIVQLLLEMGVTSPEAEDTLRAVYISEAKSIAATRGDATKVRLAAMTGVHRNFISEALRKLPRAGASNEELQYAARRVLREWFEDARYRHANGELRTLRLTGPRSFETLVREHAARIDANSVLDELVRGAAVEMVGEDEVRARGDAPQSTGLDSESLEEMGWRMRDLGRTLKHNQMRPTEPRLVETALSFEVAPRARALLARNLKARCVQFIRQVSEELHNPRIRSRVEQGEPTVRLGLTVFYFEDDAQADAAGTRRVSSESSLVVHKEQPT